MIPSYGQDGDDVLGADSNNYTYVADAMTGYAGDDIYHIDNYMDTAIESANGGNDTIILDGDFLFNPKTIGYSTPKNIENIDFRDYNLPGLFQYLVNLNIGITTEHKNMALDYLTYNRASMSANASDNTIYTSDSSGDYLKILGLGGNDTILGSTANDYLDGGVDNDNLFGGSGDDTLYGGTGNDYLEDMEGTNLLNGGAGDDTYNTGWNSTTSIVDSAGVDTILTDGTISSLADYKNIENLDASLVSASGMTLTGNALNNTFFVGLGGNNIIEGGLGNDTYVIENGTDQIVEADSSVRNSGIDTVQIRGNIDNVDLTAENYLNVENINASSSTVTSITLTGSAAVNTIIGSNIEGTDVFMDGGKDNLTDTLIGGIENNYYTIHDLKDKIMEFGSSNDSIVLADDYDDNAKTPDSATFILNDKEIESIDASGVEDRDLIIRGNLKTSTTIRGGRLNNYITCGSANDVIITEVGNNYIDGGAGADTIGGGDDNNTIYGGNDNVSDDIQGGYGNDTYIIQDTKDLISEKGWAIDTIKLLATFDDDANSKTTTKYDVTNADIEIIDASLMSKSIIINGSDSISATLKGGSGADTIKGGNADETIYGGKGNDTISGGGGTNELHGDEGNDTFLFNSQFISASIFGGSGIDIIKLVADADGKLGGAESEAISLVGTTEVENIDASAITSTLLALVGNELKNKITGTVLGDIIDGGADADIMIGGKGDDTYKIDSYLDVVTESANTKTADYGSDTIELQADSTFAKNKSYTLSANVENLDLSLLNLNSDQQKAFKDRNLIINGNASNNLIKANRNWAEYMKIMAGAGDDTIYGNVGNDYIDGGAGNDVLIGGKGDDTLTGGGGADGYLFGIGDGKDTITATDALDKMHFYQGVSDLNTNDFLFYTDKAGNLFVDYTDNGVGSDTIKLTAGKYNSGTTIELGNQMHISVNQITQYLASSGSAYAKLDAAAISALNSASESTQVAAIASVWTNANP